MEAGKMESAGTAIQQQQQPQRCSAKLERKRSCSDLNSRLKTRKLLGVGQTPDGDVHRSKLSQILGHSEQLYTQQPRGLKICRYYNALVLTLSALTSFLMPSLTACHCLTQYKYTTEQTDGQGEGQGGQGHSEVKDVSTMPHRLHGAALLVLGVFLWRTVHITDRCIVSLSLLSTLLYSSLHVLILLITWVTLPSATPCPWTSCHLSLTLSLFLSLIAGSFYFYIRLGDDGRPSKRTRPTASSYSPSTSPGRGGGANRGQAPPETTKSESFFVEQRSMEEFSARDAQEKFKILETTMTMRNTSANRNDPHRENERNLDSNWSTDVNNDVTSSGSNIQNSSSQTTEKKDL